MTKLQDKKEAAFHALSAPAKRTAIAKDVIKQCATDKMHVQSGVFFIVNSWERYDEILDSEPGKTQFNKCLPDLKCSVCALGGLFYSAVMLGNKFKLSQARGEMDIHTRSFSSKLKSYFNIRQLKLIEAAFEKGAGWSDDDDFEDRINFLKAIKFGQKYKQEKPRLIAIMKNIIENNGEFIL